MRARQAERPWFRSWWMTEKAAVGGGGLPCQHQRQLFHFASLCFASLHFYSRFHCRRSFVATNNTAGWFQLTALTPRPALCGFTFSENIQFSQKLLTVLLVTQSHPLDLSQSDALVYQEEPSPRANPFPRLKAQSASKPPFPRRRPARSCCA